MMRLILLSFVIVFLSGVVKAEDASDPLLESLQSKEQTLTVNEIDALMHQLNQCFELQLKEDGNMTELAGQVVLIHMQVSSDRIIKSAKIHDIERYQTEPQYRRTADLALRAMHQPHCARLDLPPEKYTIWKDIIVSLDIQNMV